MEDVSPSRSVFLELQEERQVMREGHAFLDEKRTLLAGEIIAQLKHHADSSHRLRAAYEQGIDALKTAVTRHGLEAVQCYPHDNEQETELVIERRGLLGIPLLEAIVKRKSVPGLGEAEPVDADLLSCRAHFRKIIDLLTEHAAISGNLLRLYRDYAKTERRVRALEDIMIPELDETLRELDSHLEGMELEEAVRVRSRLSR